MEFKNGVNYSSEQVGKGVKVIGVADFLSHFRLPSTDGLMRVNFPEGLSESYYLQPNDLLFVRSNGNKALVGRVLLIETCDEPVTHSGFTIRGRFVDPRIDPLFGGYFFSSALVKAQLLKLGGGTNISNLSQAVLESVTLPLPSLPEQQKIAAILSTGDRAIELTEKLIVVKQKRKQALMQQLFSGKLRLPGFEKSTWKRCHLDDVAKNSTRRNGLPNNDRTVYSVTNSVGMVPMDEGIIGESIDRYKAVSRFDFAYNPMRINVGSIAMWDGNEEVLVSPDYVVFRCGSKLDAQFLNHFRKTHHWRHFVNRAGGGSVRVRIYFSDLGGIKLNLPPIEEQRAIADVLNAQDKEITLLGRRLDALKRQKKGLMQQLLTGKVRVSFMQESMS